MIKLINSILRRIDTEYSQLYNLQKKKKKENDDFLKSFHDFVEKSRDFKQRFELSEKDTFPCLNDKTNTTNFDTHYIYHPAWAARILQKSKPGLHVDISSTLHFCSIVSAFIRVKFYDYRPANLNLTDLELGSADLTKLQFPDNSISSLSCMHTIEHIGLGRYGDPIDYDGDIKAANELKRVLAYGGDLLIAVPTGKPKLLFNAHRIYGYDMILEMFRGLELIEFSLITDDALTTGMSFNASKELADKQNYGCGCFWFKKNRNSG